MMVNSASVLSKRPLRVFGVVKFIEMVHFLFHGGFGKILNHGLLD